MAGFILINQVSLSESLMTYNQAAFPAALLPPPDTCVPTLSPVPRPWGSTHPSMSCDSSQLGLRVSSPSPHFRSCHHPTSASCLPPLAPAPSLLHQPFRGLRGRGSPPPPAPRLWLRSLLQLHLPVFIPCPATRPPRGASPARGSLLSPLIWHWGHSGQARGLEVPPLGCSQVTACDSFHLEWEFSGVGGQVSGG